MQRTSVYNEKTNANSSGVSLRRGLAENDDGALLAIDHPGESRLRERRKNEVSGHRRRIWGQ